MNGSGGGRGSAVVLGAVGLFLVLFVPIYTVQWIGYGVLLLIAFSYGWMRIVRAGLHVDRGPQDLVAYRYQNTPVVIRVANRSVLPVVNLLVSDNPGTLYAGYENARLLSLRPGERRSVTYRVRGLTRGSYRIGPVSVRYSDPLGFFPVSSTIPAEVRLIVYPTILPVTLSMDAGLPAGTVTALSRVYEDPTRYRSVREYTAGDELRRINWKVSARTGTLHSTEWLPTITFPVMVVLNLTASDYEQRRRYHHMERTIDAAASLIHHLAERGQPVGFATSGVLSDRDVQMMPWIPVGAGPGRAADVLQVLAQLRPNEGPPPPVVPGSDEPSDDVIDHVLSRGPIPFGTRVFYLGPPLTAERVSSLLASVGDRARARLCFTDEQVSDARSQYPESVDVWRITEFGDDVIVPEG